MANLLAQIMQVECFCFAPFLWAAGRSLPEFIRDLAMAAADCRSFESLPNIYNNNTNNNNIYIY